MISLFRSLASHVHNDTSSRIRVIAIIFLTVPTTLFMTERLSIAAPGDLDGSFGVAGKLLIDMNPGSSDDFAEAHAVALQADGKIILAGQIGHTSFNENFGLARINPDGSLDTGFGTNGRVITDFNGLNDIANAVAIQPDGRIVVAGATNQAGGFFFDFALARYNSNGALDTTFGSNGKVTTDFLNFNDFANAVAIQADGKIVAVGQVFKNSTTIGDSFGIARYNADGSLDQTFGSSGKVITDFSNSGSRAYAMVIQPDGRIVAVGQTFNSGTQLDVAIARYNTDGSLDSNFGVGGKVVTDFSGRNDSGNAIAIQPDGKLVVAGSASNVTNFDFGLLRYNSNGSLDTAFGNGGKVTTDFSDIFGNSNEGDFGQAVLVQADGKLVIAGTIRTDNSSPVAFDFGLARYNSNGSLDSTFGPDGRVLTDLFNLSDDRAFGAALQSDGKIVLAGKTTKTVTGFGVARYIATPPTTKTVQFSAPSFTVGEGCIAGNITVTRSGDTSATATVDFTATDGSASQRTDFEIGAGTISFAPGQTSASVPVLITQNAYQEGNVSASLSLLNPTGGVAIGTQGSATLVIVDNSPAVQVSNPIDDTQIFVCQHYHDFLAREADASGLDYWTRQVTECNSDVQCIRNQRIAVSDAFFFEQEFQDTGAFVYRVYQAAFGSRPSYLQFILDRTRLVGGASLDARKTTFINAFVLRSGFRLPSDPAAYVDTLNTNTGNSLTQAQRDMLVAGLIAGTETRGSVLRKTAENSRFIDREYNNTFVSMLYFGYLRRDPEPGGFAFWSNAISRFPLRDVTGQHSLVCSFLTSTEYQQRFGAILSHSNSECSR